MSGVSVSKLPGVRWQQHRWPYSVTSSPADFAPRMIEYYAFLKSVAEMEITYRYMALLSITVLQYQTPY